MKRKVKKSAVSLRIIFISAFFTLLIIGTLCCFVIIGYRVESQLNVNPITALAVSEIKRGTYSYETFSKSGIVDTAALQQGIDTANKLQAFIPVNVRLYIQVVTAGIGKCAEILG